MAYGSFARTAAMASAPSGQTAPAPPPPEELDEPFDVEESLEPEDALLELDVLELEVELIIDVLSGVMQTWTLDPTSRHCSHRLRSLRCRRLHFHRCQSWSHILLWRRRGPPRRRLP